MIFGSVCSGIEAASVAWEPLGWRCSFMSEIEAFPRAVLEYRLGAGSANGPALHGDFTTIQAGQYEPIDLLVGGTPCQSFSIAGLRGGLGNNRGNLALEYLRLADRLRPRWLVWENVPGVLSSGGGRDFGSILGGMVELGYGVAYRVLDAQYVRVDGMERAVAQRRRRVFVVGYLGDWRRAAAVLFERESLSGHPAPRRESGEGTAAGTEDGAGGGGWPEVVAPTLNAAFGDKQGLEDQHVLNGGGLFVPVAFGVRQSDVAPTFRTDGHDGSHANGGVMPAVAVSLRGRDGGATAELGGDIASAIRTGGGGGDKPHVLTQYAVRRLTPRECERLQGFPDDWTQIPWKGKPADKCPDGPRYKAIGNSMAVNVMRWIGRRIELVNRITVEASAA